MHITKVPVKVTIRIEAATSKVWQYLTVPEFMEQWMGEPEMHVNVHTDWKVSHPIRIAGFHHVAFVNTGTVLQFGREKAIRYTHLSSLSRLANRPENHSVIGFKLLPNEGQTDLAVTVTNFPTEAIYRHLAFYWRSTVPLLKRIIEQGG
ncbi:SRPBCC domain-containing protein [Parapedobacter sp. GCM10030251]|uniref:SRPBCC family protein n=1 Tax=Parapedobacter sp. GCM10030251 TaxID=3273419 RepID=UPI00362431F9